MGTGRFIALVPKLRDHAAAKDASGAEIVMGSKTLNRDANLLAQVRTGLAAPPDEVVAEVRTALRIEAGRCLVDGVTKTREALGEKKGKAQ
ncbi:MAG: hypothetical protein OXC07_02215 [Kistimonas sp.]|nr:hypothetical protein [Kistimonas sp.]